MKWLVLILLICLIPSVIAGEVETNQYRAWYSEDITCGEECISYFNITMKKRSISLGNIEKFIEYHSNIDVLRIHIYDNGWRKVDLENDTLEKNVETMFRLTAFKENTENGKWSVPSFGIDPWWYGTDFGWEYVNDSNYIHLWNEHNDYYFNTSNGVILANKYAEPWSKDEICIDYINESICQLTHNFDRVINEVFNESINITFNRSDIKITYQLNRGDNDLSVYVDSSGFNIRWITWDVNVGNNEHQDFIFTDSFYLLNETFNQLIYNLTDDWVYYGDTVTGENVWTKINKSQNYYVKANNTMSEIGINSNKTKFNWLDATCTWSCDITDPTENQNITQLESFNMDGGITFSGTCLTRTTATAEVNSTAMTGITGLSTTDTNPQTVFCTIGSCPFSDIEVTGKDQGIWVIRWKCAFNRQTKYSSTVGINVSTLPFNSCPSYTDVTSDTNLSAESSVCYNITSSNVYFNCKDNWITGNQPLYTPAIIMEGVENITIANCKFRNHSHIIRTNLTTNTLIVNYTFVNNTISSDMDNSDQKAIYHINGSNHRMINGYIDNYRVNNTLTGDCFASSADIFYLENVDNVFIEDVQSFNVNNFYTGNIAGEGCTPHLVESGSLLVIRIGQNITLRNVLFNSNFKLNSVTSDVRGLQVTQESGKANNVSIKNVTLEKCKNCREFLRGSNITIDGLTHKTCDEIVTSTSLVGEITIKNSYMENCSADFFKDASDTGNVIMTNNTFKDNKTYTDYLFIFENPTVFADNRLYNFSATGVFKSTLEFINDDNNISNNVFINTSNDQIGLFTHSGSELWNNQFINNDGNDILCLGVNETIVVNGTTSMDLSSCTLKFGWWADFYVNDYFSNPVSGAFVNVTELGWDSRNPNKSLTTGGDGFTGNVILWQGRAITDNEVKNDTTPHTVNVSKDGLFNFSTVFVNESKTWVFTLNILTSTCYPPVSGVWIMREFCNYTNEVVEHNDLLVFDTKSKVMMNNSGIKVKNWTKNGTTILYINLTDNSWFNTTG